MKINEEFGDKRGLANIMLSIAYVHSSQGDVLNSLKSYHKCLKLYEELGYKNGIGTTLVNIGDIYKEQEDFPTARIYFHKSLELGNELGDKSLIIASLLNLGSVYNNPEDLSKTLEYFKKGLKISQEVDDKAKAAKALIFIGQVYGNRGDPSVVKSKEESLRAGKIIALNYFNKSLLISEELEDKVGMSSSLKNIGSIYEKQGDRVKALFYGEKSMLLAQELGYPYLIQATATLLSNSYQKQGNYSKALEFFKLKITMRDSINNETTQKAAAQQEAKYEYEKQKAIDDAEHDKLLAIEKEAKAKQKVITIAIGVGLGLVVLFLIFVFNRLQVTKKQKLVIEHQRDEVEEAHKEIRDSINYAERIQRSFLATDELLNNNLKDYFVFFQPKDVVSGDFYWAGKLSNNNFAVVNADSTGHGVPGAIMSILNISSIEKAIDEKLVKPADIFNHTRNTIIELLSKDGSAEGGKDGMDASIISFDFENNKFTYTAAQNPIWVIRGEELIEIKGEKMPIGKHDNDSIPFIGGEFETKKGDVVYSVTDGFQDQFGGEKGKKFKVRPFKNYLISIAHLPMQEQREKLNQTFTTWKGEEEQVDDVCVIGVRI